MKKLIKRLPVIGPWIVRVRERLRFRGSRNYWESHYAAGGTSGAGSYGRLARFKAEVLNAFVEEQGIRSVVEFGCGDGNQLSLARYPSYLGFDVSPSAVARCRQRFAGDTTKQFRVLSEDRGETAELALSLDVLYHLVEDDVFETHLRRLFAAATRFAVIYSTNTDQPDARPVPHMRNRLFTAWVERCAPDWELIRQVPNPWPPSEGKDEESAADFFLYRRRPAAAGPPPDSTACATPAPSPH